VKIAWKILSANCFLDVVSAIDPKNVISIVARLCKNPGFFREDFGWPCIIRIVGLMEAASRAIGGDQMAPGIATLADPRIRQGMPRSSRKAGTVYAISFDMDIDQLRSNYGDPYNNAYVEIRKVLQRHGFAWQQGSVYFGSEAVTSVTCVLAAMDLAQSLPWFAASIRDIRMLRIDELNDLMPAVQQVADGSA
jgi:virulence-associated protein VapD